MKRSEAFLKHLRDKNPGVDVDLAISIFEEQFDSIDNRFSTPDERLEFQERIKIMKSDINVALALSTMRIYNEQTKK